MRPSISLSESYLELASSEGELVPFSVSSTPRVRSASVFDASELVTESSFALIGDTDLDFTSDDDDDGSVCSAPVALENVVEKAFNDLTADNYAAVVLRRHSSPTGIHSLEDDEDEDDREITTEKPKSTDTEAHPTEISGASAQYLFAPGIRGSGSADYGDEKARGERNRQMRVKQKQHDQDMRALKKSKEYQQSKKAKSFSRVPKQSWVKKSPGQNKHLNDYIVAEDFEVVGHKFMQGKHLKPYRFIGYGLSRNAYAGAKWSRLDEQRDIMQTLQREWMKKHINRNRNGLGVHYAWETEALWEYTTHGQRRPMTADDL